MRQLATALSRIFRINHSLWLLFVLLNSCNSPQSDNSVQDSKDTGSVNADLGDPPIVDVQVTFDDSVFKSGDEIGMQIKLVNNSDKEQVVMFDRPALFTGGPWVTSAEVKQLDVVNSELRYLSKIVMNSNSYSAAEVKDSSYVLQPGKFITGHYNLSDLITFNTPENKLSPGRYEIQVFHAGNGSNQVVIRIEK